MQFEGENDNEGIVINDGNEAQSHESMNASYQHHVHYHQYPPNNDGRYYPSHREWKEKRRGNQRGRGRGRGNGRWRERGRGRRGRRGDLYRYNHQRGYREQRGWRGRGRGRGRGWERGRGRGRDRRSYYNEQHERNQIEPFRMLLNEWKLDHYADKLKDEGWDDPNYWNELAPHILMNDIGFKKGDIVKFNRNYKEYTKKQHINSDEHKMNDNDNDNSINNNIEDRFLKFEKEYGWNKNQRVIFMIQENVKHYGNQSEITSKFDAFIQASIFGGNDKKMIKIMSSGVYTHFVDYVLNQIKSTFEQIHPPQIPTISTTLKLEKTYNDGQKVWLLIAIFDIQLKVSNDFGDRLIDMKYINGCKFGISVYSKKDPNIEGLIEKEGDIISGNNNNNNDGNGNGDIWRMNENYNTWNEEKMSEYLVMIGMSEYDEKFKEMNVSGKDFNKLRDIKYLIKTIGMNGEDAVKLSELIKKRMSEYKKIKNEMNKNKENINKQNKMKDNNKNKNKNKNKNNNKKRKKKRPRRKSNK